MTAKRDEQGGADDEIATLRARVAELEELVRRLDWKLLILATSKLADPRYPYWNFMLEHGLFDERETRLQTVLSRLSDRVTGDEIPEPFRKDVEGVPRALLYGDGPPTVDEVFAALAAVTGLELRRQHVTLLAALAEQGLFSALCEHVLSQLDDPGGQRDDSNTDDSA